MESSNFNEEQALPILTQEGDRLHCELPQGLTGALTSLHGLVVRLTACVCSDTANLSILSKMGQIPGQVSLTESCLQCSGLSPLLQISPRESYLEGSKWDEGV